MTATQPDRRQAIAGSLLGMAIGDALGLPYEGLSRRRAAKLLGEPDRYRLLPGRGLVSDDTEHACMVAQALIASGQDPERFARELARRLRWWLLSMPAGIGLATLKATLMLCCGASPHRSGVFSAGNGPAMRAPILGAAITDIDTLREFVRVSTTMTHSDPKAWHGAWAVALAARIAASGQPVSADHFLRELRTTLSEEPDMSLLPLIEQAVDSVSRGNSTEHFAEQLGLQRGVTGFVNHTVPVVLHAWLSFPDDHRAAITSLIRCGGDTDTTAAIAGGIIGCRVGSHGLPNDLLESLRDWPRSVPWISQLASRLADCCENEAPANPPRLSASKVLVRNVAFAALVLAHGFRRLLPPY
jgi:ADP-ribosyl-[dinitrogen reductase] hydrolase